MLYPPGVHFGRLFIPGQSFGNLIPSAGFSNGLLFSIIGDSHAVGAADPNKADTAFRLSTVIPGVLINGRYASGAGVDPPSWVNFDADMVMRTLVAHSTLGVEMTFGSSLLFAPAISSPAVVEVGGNGYGLATNWLPTSTFMLASTGKNLFNTWVDRVRSFATSTSRTNAGTVILLGSNDVAGGVAIANAYQTNATATAAAIRVAFGATHPIVWVKVNANAVLNTGTLATVRTAQDAVAASDTRMSLIDNDDLRLLSDGLHFGSNANLTLGNRCAFAMRTLLGYPLPDVQTFPTVIGWGPSDFGTGTLGPTSYAGVRDGDLELMLVMNGILSGSTVSASLGGWTPVGVQQTTGASSIFVNFNLFSRPVTSGLLAANNGHTAPTNVTGSDSRNWAKIFAVRGANSLTAANVDTFAQWSQNAATNSKTIPAITTLSANCGVFVFGGGWCGSASRTQVITNSTLESFTELQDGADLMPATDAMALTLSVGTKTAPGSTGTCTETITGGTTIGLAVTIAVKP